MAYKSEKIAMGISAPQPIKDVLQKLVDPELPETEFWRIMTYLTYQAATTNDEKLLRKLDLIKQQRTGKPFPRAEVTTPQNLPAQRSLPEKMEKLNLNAPRINLQRMLEKLLSASVFTDKKKYDQKWIEKLVDSLMKEYGELLAKKWKSQPNVIRGQVLGTLRQAGVIKGSCLSIARVYLDEKENTKEVGTFSRYMGRMKDAPFYEYLMNFVASPEKQAE